MTAVRFWCGTWEYGFCQNWDETKWKENRTKENSGKWIGKGEQNARPHHLFVYTYALLNRFCTDRNRHMETVKTNRCQRGNNSHSFKHREHRATRRHERLHSILLVSSRLGIQNNYCLFVCRLYWFHFRFIDFYCVCGSLKTNRAN